MSQRLPVTAARSCLAAILLSSSVIALGEGDAFSKWASAHAAPLITVEAAEDFRDLLPLKSAIGDARIVALGEPMHGAHEPLSFRNRLFRFLIEQVGFTAVAFESGFTESARVGDYLNGGAGDVQSVIATNSVPRYVENGELVQWLRDYNAAATLTGHRRIRFYGIDMTTGGRLNGPTLALDYALSYLARADPSAVQKIRDSLVHLPKADDRGLGPLSDVAQAEFEAGIESIASAMQESRKSLIARSSKEEYRWALRNLDAARQLAKCLPVTPLKSGTKIAWAVASTCRDAAMAENVRWALENEGRKGRLLVFAHAGHVMSTLGDGRSMREVPIKPPLMGFHLRKVYGDDMYVIAMCTATTAGELNPAKPLEEGSVESALAGVGLPRFFLDLRQARNHEEPRAWLTTARSVLANVDAQGIITPSTAADAFVFVDPLTPARRYLERPPR